MNCASTIGDVTNIGAGFEISIEDTVIAISEAMGRKVEIKLDSVRLRPESSEVDRLYAGTKKAQKAFGWKPQYCGRLGFIEGLKLTADWFSQPKIWSCIRLKFTMSSTEEYNYKEIATSLLELNEFYYSHAGQSIPFMS